MQADTYINYNVIFNTQIVVVNCRNHHVTASMTTIDLYNKPRTGRFGVGANTF